MAVMAVRQGGCCERDNRYGGYNGEYASKKSPAHNGSCCWQYWTLLLDLSRRTHYATIICYAARMNEFAVDREAIACHGKRLSLTDVGANPPAGWFGIPTPTSGNNAGTLTVPFPPVLCSCVPLGARKFFKFQIKVLCHGRGREFESRRPRHSFQALAGSAAKCPK